MPAKGGKSKAELLANAADSALERGSSENISSQGFQTGTLPVGPLPPLQAGQSKPAVRLIAIEKIIPDPFQSRGGLLPPDLMFPVYNRELSPADALRIWEEGIEGDVLYQKRWEDLHLLAESIEQEGLINPIHVYHPPENIEQYLIESGERRYWAHWLLARNDPEKFSTIRAIVENGLSVERQVDENEEVSSLSAIGQARNVARAYLIELQVPQPDIRDVDPMRIYKFYRQVTLPFSDFLDQTYRPRQFWGKFERKLKLSRKSVLDRLDIFRLPASALAVADAADLNFAQLKEILRAEKEEVQSELVDLAAYFHLSAPALRKLARLSIDNPTAYSHEVAIMRGQASREKRKKGTPLEIQSTRLTQAVKGLERLNGREIEMIAERIISANPEAISEVATNLEKLAHALKTRQPKAF